MAVRPSLSREGKSVIAVAHLALSRSQSAGPGILGIMTKVPLSFPYDKGFLLPMVVK